jgi:hypothetical protein
MAATTKLRIGERLLGVMVRAEPRAPSVREDDERELCARDGTILHAFQVEIGADRIVASMQDDWRPRQSGLPPTLQSRADGTSRASRGTLERHSMQSRARAD